MLRWRLSTRFRVPWGMWQIQRAPARPDVPLISNHIQGVGYNSCVRSAMLHASKTWAPALSDLHRLKRNDRAMIRRMCGVTTKDQVSWQDVLERMQLDDLAKVLRIRRLRRHGHVEHSDGWLKKVQKINLTGGRDRPKKTWTEAIDMDCLARGLNETHFSDRNVCSGRLRSAVRVDPPPILWTY